MLNHGPFTELEVKCWKIDSEEDGLKKCGEYFSKRYETVGVGKFGGVCFLENSSGDVLKKFIIRVSDDDRGEIIFIPVEEERERVAGYRNIGVKTHDCLSCVSIVGRITAETGYLGRKVQILGVSHHFLFKYPPLLAREKKNIVEVEKKLKEFYKSCEGFVEMNERMHARRARRTRLRGIGGSSSHLEEDLFSSKNEYNIMSKEKISKKKKKKKKKTWRKKKKSKKKKKLEEEIEGEEIQNSSTSFIDTRPTLPDENCMYVEEFSLESFCATMRDIEKAVYERDLFWNKEGEQKKNLGRTSLQLALGQGKEVRFRRRGCYEELVRRKLGNEKIPFFTADHLYGEEEENAGLDVVLTAKECNFYFYSEKARKVEEENYKILDRGAGVNSAMAFRGTMDLRVEMLDRFRTVNKRLGFIFFVLIGLTLLVIFMCARSEGKFGQIGSKLDEIDNRFDEVDCKFDEVDSKFDEVDVRFDEVDVRFDEVDVRFDAVDSKFDEIDNRFDEVDVRFDEVDVRFDEVDVRFDAVDSKFDEIDNRFDEVDVRFDEVDVRFDEVDVRFDEVDNRFDEIDGRLEEIDVSLGVLNSTLHVLLQKVEEIASYQTCQN